MILKFFQEALKINRKKYLYIKKSLQFTALPNKLKEKTNLHTFSYMKFEDYPKIRKDLPIDFQTIYSEHYKKNREGATTATSLSQRMEVWMHKKVAADLKSNDKKSTLEIGAGTLNQLKYENTEPYDIIEPFIELFENSTAKDKISNIYKDISEIKDSNRYDRITSVATFEHITDLPMVVAKTCILLKENCTLRVSIPNEGTFLWKLGYMLTTGIEFKMKYALNYEVLMKHEHVNTANEIEQVIRYFYQDVKTSFLGIHKQVAFYRFYECSNPNINKAKKYLETIL